MWERSIRNTYSGSRSVPVLKEWSKAERRGTLSRELRNGCNSVIVQGANEV